ncbi:protein indeterminate-domain 11-like [Iris pallida]|uniref:Protein EARLY HEADING DATE 2 n=1 Tax=Iris pallida TaxID=29817 RepID=A0AAX6F9F9_IRIPA|nr:protein indeterminate-domain 11-like [Iris pallida]
MMMMMMEELASTTDQQYQGVVEESMSNLTSASASSPNQQSSFASPDPSHQLAAKKKKRSLPGNPDPDAEVIALSPKSLMATNRFMCEVCNKGFQRDQNLQLHRRGHNLPWKLKQRSSKDVPRKKVYVCPEASCVHHHPSRALGDLTGIKKHFSRKHGEKKYKCDKCSKKYAVQSDWKAHSKTCGTREYKCDCGTIFSRRDSFITHRAFCDALAEESAKAIPPQLQTPLLFSHHEPTHESLDQQQQHFHSTMAPEMMNISSSAWLLPTSIDHHSSEHTTTSNMYSHNIDDSSNALPLQLANYQAPASPHLSATALLQKAAQMGATMSRPDRNGQMAAHTIGFSHDTATATTAAAAALQERMMMAPPLSFDQREYCGLVRRNDQEGGGGDGLTRDFLGLRAFSHRDILSMTAAGLPCMNTSSSSSSSFQQCQQNNINHRRP